MHPRHRDGRLGMAATVALVVAARLLGYSPRRLARSHPRPFAAGALGAMAIELAMALAPDRARVLWDRRTARWGGTLLVAAGGPALALLGGWGRTAACSPACSRGSSPRRKRGFTTRRGEGRP